MKQLSSSLLLLLGLPLLEPLPLLSGGSPLGSLEVVGSEEGGSPPDEPSPELEPPEGELAEPLLADPLLPELLLPDELLPPVDGWLDGGSTVLELGSLLLGGSPLEPLSPLDSGTDVSLLLGAPDEGSLDGDDEPLSLDEPVSEPLDAEPDELSSVDELPPDDEALGDDEPPPLELESEELESGPLPDGSLLDGPLPDEDSDDEEPLLPLLDVELELEDVEPLLEPGPEELEGGPPLLGG